ncbi:hypothetical protein [Nocardia camponoti]|uniref:DUF1963 domain-containing protein n=1 Tax=Nocardia camponoti TaxID=1616106 RepID=A0A917VED7_9NOCA|nr:hypothetical protein [Nocardia camponoti]GGK70056.1 hypothetical protein GCM10011591_47730 [Nocardia camponoti]
MKAYDLGFGDSADKLAETPGGEPLVLKAAVRSGWVGSDGPAIDPATWPRGPVTGLPMMHALTLALPADYQRRGAQYPAIAFFQGEGQFANPADQVEADAESPDPVLRDLASTRVHPQLQLMHDEIGGVFALVWLTAAEYAAGPVAPPADVREEGTPASTDGGTNAWDNTSPTIGIWLAERDDPNVGIPPVEYDPYTSYKDPLTDDSGWEPWAEPLFGRSHLGGTAFPVQALPEGLTQFYLEIEEVGGLNLGGGIAQIDLESGVFDWACP